METKTKSPFDAILWRFAGAFRLAARGPYLDCVYTHAYLTVTLKRFRPQRA